MPLNIGAVDDKGQASIIGTVDMTINGAILATADGALAVADYWHYRLDAGDLLGFSSGELWGSGADCRIWNLIVPTSNMVMRFLLRGSADMNFEFYVAPTVDSSGTAITPVSFDQTIEKPASAATFYHTATIDSTGLGTLIFQQYIPSGQGRFSGGSGVAGQDWGLAAGTVYLVGINAHAIGTYNLSGEYYTK